MIRSGSFTRGVNYRKLSEKYVSLLLLLFLTPLVFLILGAIVSSSPNHRPELIRTYNLNTYNDFVGIMDEQSYGSIKSIIL